MFTSLKRIKEKTGKRDLDRKHYIYELMQQYENGQPPNNSDNPLNQSKRNAKTQDKQSSYVIKQAKNSLQDLENPHSTFNEDYRLQSLVHLCNFAYDPLDKTQSSIKTNNLIQSDVCYKNHSQDFQFAMSGIFNLSVDERFAQILVYNLNLIMKGLLSTQRSVIENTLGTLLMIMYFVNNKALQEKQLQQSTQEQLVKTDFNQQGNIPTNQFGILESKLQQDVQNNDLTGKVDFKSQHPNEEVKQSERISVDANNLILQQEEMKKKHQIILTKQMLKDISKEIDKVKAKQFGKQINNIILLIKEQILQYELNEKSQR